MSPHDVREFTLKRPFQPYRICTTDGRTYDIVHPDQALVLRSRVVIAVGGRDGVGERTEHIALRHIVRIEELEPQSVPRE